jgi:hypothetical protein
MWIDKQAFDYCESLKTITLPASIKHIDDHTFHHCKSLNSITFQGTMEQWGKIRLGFNWKDSNVVVHCIDGDVEIQDEDEWCMGV